MGELEAEFEWDDVKNRSNVRKHGIAFEESIHVFGDDDRLNEPAHSVVGEVRHQTIGRPTPDATLIVIHTRRFNDLGGPVIRVISARPASRKERQRYDKARKDRSLQSQAAD